MGSECLIPGRGEGALKFHFGVSVRPNGPNRGAREQTTAEFGTLVNGISEQKCNHENWVLIGPIWGFQTELFANFEALERKISRNLWFGDSAK